MPMILLLHLVLPKSPTVSLPICSCLPVPKVLLIKTETPVINLLVPTLSPLHRSSLFDLVPNVTAPTVVLVTSLFPVTLIVTTVHAVVTELHLLLPTVFVLIKLLTALLQSPLSIKPVTVTLVHLPNLTALRNIPTVLQYLINVFKWASNPRGAIKPPPP